MKVRGKKPILGVKSARWTVLCWTIIMGITLLLGLFYFSISSKTKSVNKPENSGKSPISVTARSRVKELISRAKNAALEQEKAEFYSLQKKKLNSRYLQSNFGYSRNLGKSPRPTSFGSNWGKENNPALRNFSRWGERWV